MTACPDEEFGALLEAFGRGRIAEAVTRSEGLVEEFSGDPRLWNLRAAILAAAGDEPGALAAWERSLALHPDNPKALNNRAVFHLGRKRIDAAIADLQRALAVSPDDAEVLNALGAAQTLKGELRPAEASLRRALAAAPDNAEALANLGVVLCGLGRADEAIGLLERALALEPGHERARAQLGKAFVAVGRHDEAIPLLKEFADRPVPSPTALRDLAIAYEELGEREAARAAAERAIAVAPDMVPAYLLLARLGRFSADDPALAAMRALAEDPAVSARDRRHLAFAIGRALDGIEGHEEAAFAALAEGNRLRRAEYDWSLDTERALFERLKTRPLFPEGAEGRRPTPLFILGMPRSGTTLVEQILASHSAVAAGGELDALTASVRDTGWLDDPSLTPNPAAVARAYRERLPASAPGARYLTDKMPLNFRWIGFIAEAFPEAPIVHLRRHPMAVCWSIYSLMFGDSSTLFGYDQRELGGYYRLYRDLMKHWDNILPGRVYHLDYETLTENQEAETRRLLAHLGLDFEPACLDFQNTARAVKTASALQVRQKMYRGSSDRWRRYAHHLGPLREALGDALDGWD